MSDALSAAIRALATEGIESDAAFELVAPALLQFGEDDLADRVMAVAGDEPWEGIAAFLNIASWDVSPAAESKIFRTAETWLAEAKDLQRVQVALHLEVIPFCKRGADPRILAEVLERVSTAFPQAAARCRELLQQAADVRRGQENERPS